MGTGVSKLSTRSGGPPLAAGDQSSLSEAPPRSLHGYIACGGPAGRQPQQVPTDPAGQVHGRGRPVRPGRGGAACRAPQHGNGPLLFRFLSRARRTPDRIDPATGHASQKPRRLICSARFLPHLDRRRSPRPFFSLWHRSLGATGAVPRAARNTLRGSPCRAFFKACLAIQLRRVT